MNYYIFQTKITLSSASLASDKIFKPFDNFFKPSEFTKNEILLIKQNAFFIIFIYTNLQFLLNDLNSSSKNSK